MNAKETIIPYFDNVLTDKKLINQ
ncbi:Protein of unknown function [Bacillus mycoides]|uniref:Uncharacterized protein n=1 Tax=Bacillus mycoides TaxID=1405 RepID=A0A1G4EG43_BACMY|nr:Protein of unknown function [Bacillus mycoides]